MFAFTKKLIWALLLFALFIPHKTLAANGTPSSNGFGYGVRVDLQGSDPYTAIREAGKFNIDWIAVDFNWQYLQLDSENPPAWESFDNAMRVATENQLAVMISITQAPIWAMEQDGPDAIMTGKLASDLVHRYEHILLAIEIFPSANTVKGWGTTPNPEAYTRLLKTTAQTVRQLSPDVLIIGAGLTPVNSKSSQGMDDLEFLREIYAAGIAESMPVVGLRLPPLSSDPLVHGQHSDTVTVRHYEDIRRIMTENEHKSGLIWVTGFSWKADTIGTPNEQAAWMKQAYLLFRSQLYIGAAFFNSLNSSQSQASKLLLQGGVYHPGFEELIQIIAQDHDEQTIMISIDFPKRISHKNYQKADTQ